MKKLSKIDESAWGEMRKRSSGEIIRKEDTLTDEEKVQLNQYISDYGREVVLRGRGGDACNLDEFIDYLETDRKIDDRIINYVKENWFDEICDLVSEAIETIENEYEKDMNESLFHKKEEFTKDDFGILYNIIRLFVNTNKKKVKVTIDKFLKYIDILQNYGCNNGHLEKIINFVKSNWDDGVNVEDLINNFSEAKLNESAWGEMRKRSSGEVIRREDDINLFDIQQMCDYIKNRYKPVFQHDEIEYHDNYNFNFDVHYVNVPLFKYWGSHSYICLLADNTNNDKWIELSVRSNFKEQMPFLKKKIEDEYSTKKVFYESTFWYGIKISPKDGSNVTNEFFISVIDYILSIINKTDTPDVVKTLEKQVNESAWGEMRKRSSGEEVRKEDIKPQDYEHWWKNIPLDDAPKYKKEELRLWDFLYDLIIWKVEKAMNIQKPGVIRIYFKYEDAWYLSIFHNTSHGADNYTMEANGVRHYNPVKYSEMSIQEKRSIKYRLEKKKFYVYKFSNEYMLREEPEFNGLKGVELK